MNFKKKLLIVLALIVAAGGYYYAALPAINIHSSETWFFVIFLLVALAAVYAARRKLGRKELKQSKVMKFFGVLILCVGIVYLLGSLLSSPIVNAKKYQKLLTVKEGEFTEDVEEYLKPWFRDRLAWMDEQFASPETLMRSLNPG